MPKTIRKILPMRRVKRIHFVGIGGSGMGGIAEVLHTLGYKVSGSDVHQSAMVQRLQSLDILVQIGHDAKWVHDADVLVVSSAIAHDNPEWQYAREHHIPVVQRAQMLAELMRFKQGIAISGAHGKTTTTSLIASVFAEAGHDPTFIIGGKLNSTGAHAQLGHGEILIAEADESDASFLLLHPMAAIITNIDADHLATYDGDFQKLKAAYLRFIQNLPFYGVAVVCLECEHVRAMLDDFARPIITYGWTDAADYWASDVRQDGLSMYFVVHHRAEEPFAVELSLAGKHNVLNALAAIAIARDYGVPPQAIVKALREFKGVGRRLEHIGDLMIGGDAVPVIDDYGHHPIELTVTLDAIRQAFPKRRLVMLFQPHRYTRTADLFDDFVRILSQGPDVLLVMSVYAAGETPIAGADSASLCKHIRALGGAPFLVNDYDEIRDTLQSVLEPGDILLTQGAGTVSGIAHRLTRDPIWG